MLFSVRVDARGLLKLRSTLLDIVHVDSNSTETDPSLHVNCRSTTKT